MRVHLITDTQHLNALNCRVKPVVVLPYREGTTFFIPDNLRQALHFAHCLGPAQGELTRGMLLDHLRACYRSNRAAVDDALRSAEDLVLLSPLGRTALCDFLVDEMLTPIVSVLTGEKLERTNWC